MAKGIDPQESLAALFGCRVRKLRTAAGLTQAELGRMTHVVSTRITQIERASGARPSQELAQALDAALVADNLLVDLWPYVYREACPDWVQAFMTLSARATAIRQYLAHVVPGLLQTEPYARAPERRAHAQERRAVGGAAVGAHGPPGAPAEYRPPRAVGGPRRSRAAAAGGRPGRHAGPTGPSAGHGRGTPHHRAGAAVRPRRARCPGRFPDRSGPPRRHRNRLYGRRALRPVDRGSGGGRALRGDLRSPPGSGSAPSHVARHDPIRDGGQPP